MAWKPGRRELIAAGAGLGALAILPSLAKAAWGDITGTTPSGEPVWPAGLPAGPFKILEIYLYGGLSPWETFYVRPSLDYCGFGSGADGMSALRWYDPGGVVDDAEQVCHNFPAGGTPPAPQTFDSRDAGHVIALGPATSPLWSLASRMRVFALSHELLPHEAAVPYAATGSRLGRPNLAGLGAPIQRRNQNLAPARTSPWSYVFLPAYFAAPDNLQAFSAVGQHPASSRPIVIPVGASADLSRLAQRGVAPGDAAEANRRARADDLLRVYRDRYRSELRHPSLTAPGIARSRAYAEYETALASTFDAADLASLLADAPLGVRSDQPCVAVGSAPPTGVRPNPVATGLFAAAYLLGHPTTPARYACVVDDGITTADGGGGYDTHNQGNVRDTNQNLWNTLSTLRRLIDGVVISPTSTLRINLDDTLVILNTEFGRTPFRSSGGSPEPTSGGRDHWPQAYVNVMLGGPIRSGRVVGRIDDGSHLAITDLSAGSALTATDIRAGALLAAGIDPFFEGDMFGVGDISASVRDAGSEPGTAGNIVRRLFA